MNLLHEIFNEQSTTAKMLLDNELERVKLISAKKAMRYGSSITRWLVSLALASILLAMLAIALASYLSLLLESVALGYLATAGIFLVILIIWWVSAKKMVSTVIMNLALKEIYGDE